MNEISKQEIDTLLSAAKYAATNAYAPYSHFSVGAALLTISGEIIHGANVENASYGLTVCAERSAIVSAISHGKRNFKALAIWAAQNQGGSITPCGACRQVLLELMPPEAPIITPNIQTEMPPILMSVKALLPAAFSLMHTPH